MIRFLVSRYQQTFANSVNNFGSFLHTIYYIVTSLDVAPNTTYEYDHSTD